MFRRKDKFIGDQHHHDVIAAEVRPAERRPFRERLKRLFLAVTAVVIFGSVVVRIVWGLEVVTPAHNSMIYLSQQEIDQDDRGVVPYKKQVISDLAWEQLLDKFQSFLYEPKATPDVWLPVILQRRKILCRKEHVAALKQNRRFTHFVTMMKYALNYAEARQQANGRRSNDSNQHPLSDDRPSIPLLMIMGDTKTCWGLLFPRFTWSTFLDGEPCSTVAIPCYNLFSSRPERSPNKDAFHRELEQTYPWALKKKKAVWRGAATGETPLGWEALPRAQLVNYSIWYPDLFDGALTSSSQFRDLYPNEEPKLRNFSRFAKLMDMKNYQEYRAIVDIDGNSWSARFGQLLCMNSVVIKVYPLNKNYFFDELKPWVHYIPVKTDMSDMVDALRFAVSDDHEEKVKSIIYEANEWCRQRLTKRSMAIDLYWMINGYMDLLGNNATRWSQWDERLELYQRNVTLVAVVRPCCRHNVINCYYSLPSFQQRQTALSLIQINSGRHQDFPAQHLKWIPSIKSVTTITSTLLANNDNDNDTNTEGQQDGYDGNRQQQKRQQTAIGTARFRGIERAGDNSDSAEWTSQLDTILAWLNSDVASIGLGCLGLLVVLIHRLFLVPEQIGDLDHVDLLGQETRADLLAAIACGAVLVNGVSQLDVTSALAEAVVLDGIQQTQILYPNQQQQERQQQNTDLEWALESLLVATPAKTAVLLEWESDNNDDSGGAINSWKVLAMLGVIPSNPLLQRGPTTTTNTPILDRLARQPEFGETYLPTLPTLPGRFEFTYLPSNTQLVLLLPITTVSSVNVNAGDDNNRRVVVLVLGSNRSKSFSPRDIAWCQVMAARIGTILSSSQSGATSTTTTRATTTF